MSDNNTLPTVDNPLDYAAFTEQMSELHAQRLGDIVVVEAEYWAHLNKVIQAARIAFAVSRKNAASARALAVSADSINNAVEKLTDYESRNNIKGL